jgi:hypothetical protein
MTTKIQPGCDRRDRIARILAVPYHIAHIGRARISIDTRWISTVINGQNQGKPQGGSLKYAYTGTHISVTGKLQDRLMYLVPLLRSHDVDTVLLQQPLSSSLFVARRVDSCQDQHNSQTESWHAHLVPRPTRRWSPTAVAGGSSSFFLSSRPPPRPSLPRRYPADRWCSETLS